MSDQAQEPLIGNGDGEYDDPEDMVAELLEPRGEVAANTPSTFVWLLTFSAGISGLLFGYDTGVISATLISIGTSLSSHTLTTFDKSIITASTSLSALLISPVSGVLADSLGRKKVVLMADLLFIFGAVIQATSRSVWLMVVGRAIIGLAVGAASFVTPLYIAELAPRRFRGRLVTMSVLFITLGQVVAYLLGWGFAEKGGSAGWRWMVGLGAVPASLQCLVMAGMPESPRWLVKVGRSDEAKVVLGKVYGSGKEIQKTCQLLLKGIEIEVREEEEAKRARMRGQPTRSEGKYFPGLGDTWTELFYVPGNRRALSIACLLQGLQQLCGFNSLMYFSATLFSLLGFASPTLTSLSVAITNLLFTILSLLLIDLLGRRRILLLSVPVMSLALLICAYAFIYIDLPDDTNIRNPSSNSNTTRTAGTPSPSRGPPILVVASIILYVAAYAVGLGNVPWQQSELFPLSVRSLGSSLATATNWGSNFIIGISFLGMLDILSPTWTFVVYSAICAAGWALLWFIYPETKGLGLEETRELLKDGWGVEESLKRTGI